MYTFYYQPPILLFSFSVFCDESHQLSVVYRRYLQHDPRLRIDSSYKGTCLMLRFNGAFSDLTLWCGAYRETHGEYASC